ncbi:hypothetical protein IWQ56_005085 [Coemansia nantahalensis]|uniref:Uncharacterized protein n=1 Tax=Coemansia nantahalensis TaxID=2789366 RepID=A0ACC1JLM9_9FUNG|nr:hypothetical protein IWQ57_005947 [Coemansia nantahalensis]KAJ2762255.1 hypothetical protein IWQ56_005085 [Coemansia nantahalensis]
MDYRAAARNNLGAAQPKPPSPPGARTKATPGSPGPSSGGRRANGGAALSYAATARKTSGAERPDAAAGGQSLTSLVGAAVELELVDGSAVKGALYAYDVYSGVAAVTAPAAGGKQQVTLVKAANMAAVRAAPAAATGAQLPEVRPVAPAAIEARKQRALGAARERASRIGVGVSDRAQAIFEALSKTLPCRWDQDKIVVLDEVLVDPPYVVESCRALSAAASSLPRVKKVLQGELTRLDHQPPAAKE